MFLIVVNIVTSNFIHERTGSCKIRIRNPKIILVLDIGPSLGPD